VGLFVGQLAFFHLLDYRQFKSQRVVPLRSFDPWIHELAFSSVKRCQLISGRVTLIKKDRSQAVLFFAVCGRFSAIAKKRDTGG
jgi:hypothetical protein